MTDGQDTTHKLEGEHANRSSELMRLLQGGDPRIIANLAAKVEKQQALAKWKGETVADLFAFAREYTRGRHDLDDKLFCSSLLLTFADASRDERSVKDLLIEVCRNHGYRNTGNTSYETSSFKDSLSRLRREFDNAKVIEVKVVDQSPEKNGAARP